MRKTLLTTAAAAALTLSFGAMAEASPSALHPDGLIILISSGGTSGSTGGTGSGGTGGTSGTGGAATGGTTGGATGGTTGGASTGGTTGGTTGGATTGGATTSGSRVGESGSANLSPEQRTQALRILGGANIRTVEGVTIATGQPLPSSVNLVECPETLRSLITGVRECRVVRVGSSYYIVEGGTRTVVTTIPVQ